MRAGMPALRSQDKDELMTPKHLLLTKGLGRHRERSVSFELALRDAGIAQYNLVKVTSIFPPGCTIIPKAKGLQYLSPGEIVFCVMSENSTNEPHQLIAASIGLAIPKEEDKYGYLLEHQSFDEEAENAGDYAESLAAQMLVTTYWDVSWDEHEDYSDRIAETTNVTQIATSEKDGLWTTAIVAAVFIPEGN